MKRVLRAAVIWSTALLTSCNSLEIDSRAIKTVEISKWASPQRSSELFSLKNGDSIKLVLPSGMEVIANFEDIETNEGSTIWVGRVQGSRPNDRGYVVRNGDDIVGSFYTGAYTYTLSGNKGSIQISEHRSSDLMIFKKGTRDWEAPTHEFSSGQNVALEGVRKRAAAISLNVKIIPTKELWDSLTYSKLYAKIDLIKRVTRDAFKDTGLNIAISFPNFQYFPSDSIPATISNSEVLRMITPIEGVDNKNMRLVHQLRKSDQTHFLVLLRSYPGGSNCGTAWVGGLRETPDSPPKLKIADASLYGYSVVNINDDVCSDTTLAHEIGHNLGSLHDHKTEAGSSQRGAFDHSFGHVGGSGASGFTTIMGYAEPTHPEVFLFSNPYIAACRGNPCGINNGPTPADNYTGFNTVADSVSRWRFNKDFFVDISNGQGRIESYYEDGPEPIYPKIDCPGRCFSTVPSGREITLKATPAPGFKFVQWINRQGCYENPICKMLNQNVGDVQAQFVREVIKNRGSEDDLLQQ